MSNIFYIIENIVYLILRLRWLVLVVLVAIFMLGLVLYLHGETKSPLLRLILHPVAMLLFLILALDLLTISPIKRDNDITPTRTKTKALVLSLLVFTILAVGETYSLGHTLFTPLALVASSWLYLTSRDTRGLSLVYFPLLLSLLIIAHYLVFPPSFGNDTLRDIMWSDETLRSGHYTESRVTHLAYYFPMVVLVYSTLSLAGGYLPTMASVIVGFLYLFVLGIYFLLLLRKHYGQYQYGKTGALLLFSMPIVVIWSAGFIPQAMALLFVLLLLYLVNRIDSAIVVILLSTAVVFTHPGVALFTIAYFAYMHTFSPDREKYRRPLLYMTVLYIAYFTYATTVSYMVLSNFRLFLNTLLSILFGENTAQTFASTTELNLFNQVMPWIVPIVVLTLGVNTILMCQPRHKRCTWNLLTILFSVVALAVGYAIIVLRPTSAADRYFGFPAMILLILASLPGLKAFDITGRLGRGFQYALIGLPIFAFAFAGTLTPLNPLTANPNVYSVYGLIDYSDRVKIEAISKLLSVDVPIHVYTDWRTGFALFQLILSEYQGDIRISLPTLVIGTMQLHLFGSYRYRYSNNTYFLPDSIIIFRNASLHMINTWQSKPIFPLNMFNRLFCNGDLQIYSVRNI